MRCNWFPKASCITQSFTRTFQKATSPCLPFRHAFYATFCLPRSTSTLATSPTEPAVTPTLTPAQLSRHVWQSVRLAIHARDLQAAYIIAESARLSNKPLLHNSPSKAYLATGIEFHQPVSQRLAGHALVHGLLRLGLPRKAHAVAKVMMDNGITIRTKTFEALLENLVASDGNTPRSLGMEFYNFLKTLLPKRSILSLHPSLTSGKGSRAAIDLFMCARNSKWQHRTERMYRTLIGSFLLHGELIAATLLFTAILRDCTVREALARQLEFKDDKEIEQQAVDHYRQLRRMSPYPSFDVLKEIIASIANVLSRDPVEDDAYQLSFQAALQALANLAYILDIRQMPYPHLSSLLRLLYSCPKSDDLVWVVGKNHQPIQTKAYDYFHLVLERFIHKPPRYRTQRVELDRQPALLRWNSSMENCRPLDLPACNSLLHYALRHRLSPGLANEVLLYMQDPFWKEVDFRKPVPNEVTLNIILNAARILRSPALAERALRMFYGSGNEATLVNSSSRPLLPAPPPPSKRHSMSGSSSTRFSKSLRKLGEESHELDIPKPKSSLRADKYTLVSYISYLTSTGRPDVVPELLFRVLPELAIVDHPSWGNVSAAEVDRMTKRKMAREECLKRVVGYGPHFFVSVLNALVKAGKTGLAERVWLLAREAERASWVERFNENGQRIGDGRVEGWCLPVHAYTLMLVCYGDEAKKSLIRRRQMLRTKSTGTELGGLTDTERQWVPKASGIEKRYVAGWACYIMRRNRKLLDGGASRVGRDEAGREMGVELYKSMLRGAQSVYWALRAFGRDAYGRGDVGGTLPSLPPPSWEDKIPTPDARFFNAMLRIVTHHVGHHRPRRAHTRPSHWRQHIRFADWMYRKYGVAPMNRSMTTTSGDAGASASHASSDDLLMVAEDMVKAGYGIPIGVRYLLVGRDRESLVLRQWYSRYRSVEGGKRETTMPLPWAYPADGVADGPFSLGVVKQKGLPLGRISRGRLVRKRRRRGVVERVNSAAAPRAKKVRDD
ncbi:hypothetical protein GYMLUDRAFT_903722 [Collybiopsis luxurians FD-317 M1]|uniref:Uncharacterized protein n=1 Tax=Collybiopsis luxurians FD-317 M1 TaxID=944289 RepID=A0A0D0CHG2_9AGAR|nr:hypothetical protein GYMLUDRAFT_903722 [Collybiopsis luxurians FD-317 M1]